MSIELRKLDPEKIDEIKDLFVSVYSGEPWNENWSDRKLLDEYFRELTEVRHSLNYTLYDDNELIGASIGKIKHWCGGTEYFIEEFFIRNDRQNKGYGHKFMTLIEEDLKQIDVHQIYLVTDRDKPAYDFYQKAGFNELPQLTSFFKEFK